MLEPLLALVIASTTLTADSTSLPTELASCAAVEDSLERLRCYDELAAAHTGIVGYDRFGRPVRSDELIDTTGVARDEELEPFSSPLRLAVPLDRLAALSVGHALPVRNLHPFAVDSVRIESVTIRKLKKRLVFDTIVAVDPGTDRDVTVTYELVAGDDVLATRDFSGEVDEGRQRAFSESIDYGGKLTEESLALPDFGLHITIEVVAH